MFAQNPKTKFSARKRFICLRRTEGREYKTKTEDRGQERKAEKEQGRGEGD